jgi:hypothetical protein
VNGIYARGAVYSDPRIIDLLRTKFVTFGGGIGAKTDDPEFYDKVWGHKEQLHAKYTGHYVYTAEGEKLGYVYSWQADDVLRMLNDALNRFKPGDAPKDPPAEKGKKLTLPEGARIVAVTSKILDLAERSNASNEVSETHKYKLMRSGGRIYFLLGKEECDALARGQVPDRVKNRIPFYLTNLSCGYYDHISPSNIKKFELTLGQERLQGSVVFKDAVAAGPTDQARIPENKISYDAQLLGIVEAKDGKLTRFDLVAKGLYEGGACKAWAGLKGKFPLGVAFALVDSEEELAMVSLEEVLRPDRKNYPNFLP